MQGTKRVDHHAGSAQKHIRARQRQDVIHRDKAGITKRTAPTDFACVYDCDLTPGALQRTRAGHADDAAANDGDIRGSQAVARQWADFS